MFKDFPTLDQILSFNIFFVHGIEFARDNLSSETTDEDIIITRAGVTVNIPKKENKYPGLIFALAYGVLLSGGKKPGDGSWGTNYLSGMTNY